LRYPLERLLLTSYPAARGGGCSPERAEHQLPPGGALVYLFEYQGQFGSAWNQYHPRDFPPKPTHFALTGRTLANYECWQVPSYLIRFSAAGRNFQMHVALGPRPTAARRAQVLRVLDSLRFSPLRPTPRHKNSRWRTLLDEPGDTLRSPPGWSADVTTSPRRYPPPRALFFASNLPLTGLLRWTGFDGDRLSGITLR